ncbi:MAG: CARDB domain-containing protein [Acidobacteriota bacterium]
MAGTARLAAVAAGIAIVVALAWPVPGFAQHPDKPTVSPAEIVRLAPDLVVERVEFQFVKPLTNARGGKCDLFNVVPTIANQGHAPARKFKVLLERNQGPGGAFVQPCPLCYWEVPGGLEADRKLTLEARQFNDCDLPSSFRVTGDSGRTVTESNERNNAKVATYRPRGAR